MKLENQVCSLLQAKVLKDYGIVQSHNLFYYSKVSYQYVAHLGFQSPDNFCSPFSLPDNSDGGYFISAFTVAELGKLLGEFLNYETFIDDTYTASVNKVQIHHPSIKEGNNWFCIKSDKSEAEVRAEMLINLLGHKLLEVEACNKRLLA